jgi:hypothetical protein
VAERLGAGRDLTDPAYRQLYLRLRFRGLRGALRGSLIEMRDIQRRRVSISTQKSYFDTLEFNSRISLWPNSLSNLPGPSHPGVTHASPQNPTHTTISAVIFVHFPFLSQGLNAHLLFFFLVVVYCGFGFSIV